MTSSRGFRLDMGLLHSLGAICTGLVAVMLFAATPPTVAQDNLTFTDDLDHVRDAYDAGRYLEATEVLQGMLQEVHDLIMVEMRQLFPEPFDDWKAFRPEAADGGLTLSGELTVRCHYYKTDSPETVDMEIKLKSPAAANLRMWLANPRVMERSSEGTTLVTVAGRRCIQKYDERDRSAELAFVLGVDTVVRLRGYHVDSAAPLTDISEKLDFRKIERLFR